MFPEISWVFKIMSKSGVWTQFSKLILPVSQIACEYSRESHFARNIATGEERGDTCTALIALSGRYLPNRFLPFRFSFLVCSRRGVLGGPSATPYPFIYNFGQKRYRYWQMVPLSHTYSSLELCIPFNCCKFTVFKIWRVPKSGNFSQNFHSN